MYQNEEQAGTTWNQLEQLEPPGKSWNHLEWVGIICTWNDIDPAKNWRKPKKLIRGYCVCNIMWQQNVILPMFITPKEFHLWCWLGVLDTNLVYIHFRWKSAITFNENKAPVDLLRVYPFSTYAKFSEKLAFLTPWYAHVRW